MRDGFVVCAGPPESVLDEVIAAGEARATAVIADPRWPAEVRGRAVDAARALAGPGPGFGPEARLVVFTSGSTGTPRPILRTFSSWTSSFGPFSSYTGIGRTDTVLIPGPLSSSLFLFGALHARTTGARVRFLPRWSPALAAEALQECTIAHVVPAMLPALTAAPGGLRTVVCAGAHLDPGIDRPFDLVEYYGAAELSFVAIGRPGRGLRAFEGVEVQLHKGILYARSPYLASSAAVTSEGWATAGDRARIDDNGVVTILGRDDSVICTGGSTVQAEGVEAVLRRAPGVGDVVVVGRTHASLGQVVTAVVEPTSGERPSLEGLRRFAATSLPAAERPRLWYTVERLPRNAGGKVARGTIMARFA